MIEKKNKEYENSIKNLKEKLKNDENLIENKNKKIKELLENIKENKNLLDEKENQINEYKNIIGINNNNILSLQRNAKYSEIIINNNSKKIKNFENIIQQNKKQISEYEEWKKLNHNLLKEKVNKIIELENEIENYKNKIFLFKENEEKINISLNEKNNKIIELENEIENYKNKISLFKENEEKINISLNEKDNENKQLNAIITNFKKQILTLQEKEKNNNLLLNEKENINKELEYKNRINSEKILSLEENNSSFQNIFNKKDNQIKELENIIKKKEDEISKLKKQISEISDKYKNDNDKYKDKIYQLEQQFKGNGGICSTNKNINKNFANKPLDKFNNNPQSEKEKILNEINNTNNKELSNKNKVKNEESKIYGFRNNFNDCYLNSSLQLLTRIKDLKNCVFNYEKKYQINEDNDTEGKLFIEFKKILIQIDKSKDNRLVIDPKPLKNVMGKIDEKYYEDDQEDANEFLSNFIDGLRLETLYKLKEAEIKELKNLKINDKLIKSAYDNFFNRFYIKRGYSFLIDIFYGILQSQIHCKACNEKTIKFNPYNMLELPIIQLAKKYKNKSLELTMILNEFKVEKKYESKCSNCNSSRNVYTRTLLYTFPKYLIISLGRSVDNSYINNNIIYDKNLELISDYDNKKYNYNLECVLEHSGGANSGHYWALCPKDQNYNVWYRFSDSSCIKEEKDFHSKIALILLYKMNE